MYCFDTDILAAALLREPPMQLVRRLARTPGDEQCTTAVSVAEIGYAAARNGDAELIGRVRELIAAASTVLPFDHEAAEVYGSLRAQLERLGVRLDEPSLRIAAIALSRDLTLVTASARLYDRVPGLRIENWLEPDDAELEPPEDAEDAEDAEPAQNGDGWPLDGSVAHTGLLPSLEARARAATRGTAADEADEADEEPTLSS
jgi:tRNA(fMet)-specific endonuclease VapC